MTPLVNLEAHKTLVSYVGGLATYDLTVVNGGPNVTVGALVLTDPLPAGLSGAAMSGDGWQCATAAEVVTCRYDNALAVGAAATLRLTAHVTAAPGAAVRNTATVVGAGLLGEVVTETPELTVPWPDQPNIGPDWPRGPGGPGGTGWPGGTGGPGGTGWPGGTGGSGGTGGPGGSGGSGGTGWPGGTGGSGWWGGSPGAPGSLRLPFTGFVVGPLLLLAGALIAGGGGLLVGTRRRVSRGRTADPPGR